MYVQYAVPEVRKKHIVRGIKTQDNPADKSKKKIVDPYGKTQENPADQESQVQRTQWTHMKYEEKASSTKRASKLMQEETTFLPVLLTVKESRKQERKLPHASQKVRLN